MSAVQFIYMKDFEGLLDEAKAGDFNIGACVRICNSAGKVLLIKRTTDDFFGDIWEIPGGAVDPGEDVREAAVREVHEETGLVINPTELCYSSFFDFYNIETGKHKRKFVFTILADGDVVVSHEHNGYQWASLQDVSKMKRQSQYEHYELWDDHYNAIMFAA